MRRAALAATLTALLIGAAGCGGDSEGSEGPRAGAQKPGQGQDERPIFVAKPYSPDPAEEYPEGKRLAARVAQKALTYEPGESPIDVARSLPPAKVSEAALAETLKPAIDPDRQSVGEVVYPQLSGVTPSSLGAMVITRQVLQDSAGERESVTRVLDVRLRLEGGSWRLDRVASVGGSPVPAPASLSGPAKRVTENPAITLSDSARWDIYRGSVDPTLLESLADAASKRDLSVGVLSSGHPPNVWATSRPSAHSQGFAADIYAVDDRLVVRQQDEGSRAYDLAAELVAGGAYQLGSPWVLGAGGVSSFTDEVHADHLHLQQAPAA